jgi:hypothetical protein
MNTKDNLRSQKIKRLKDTKFTELRNPYKKYNKAKWNWTEIFIEIESLKDDNSSKILTSTAKKYNINYSTLRNKYNKFKKSKCYNVDEENRGGKNKSFTENEEQEIFLFLKENFIDKNKVLCNDIIKIHAQEKFKKLHPEDKFNASIGWCNMFKKRWKLSTVKISISKIATTTYTDDEIKVFLNKCKNTLIKVGAKFFST